MTRYRPPQSRGSPYITRAGFDALTLEFQALWKLRGEVVTALSAAAAEGDRSENAEYIYRKKQLREIDRRIRYLKKRLDELKVVDAPPSDRGRIFFGAWVTLEDENGNEVRYRIVGPDEFDPDKGYISLDSPVARALMKKAIDDEVIVDLPGGTRHFFVTEIDYH